MFKIADYRYNMVLKPHKAATKMIHLDNYCMSKELHTHECIFLSF